MRGRITLAIFLLRDASDVLESSRNDLSYMPGKQAKILSDRQIEDFRFFAKTTRNPIRKSVIVLLSVKAGLRATQLYIDGDTDVQRRLVSLI